MAGDSREEAKKAEASNIAKLISAERVGWANDPKGPGSLLVERATGCVYLSFDGNSIRRPQRETFPPADRIDRGKFRSHVGFFEGVIQHMYLDVEGNVTVGIGHLLKDVAAAEALPFYRRQSKANPHPVHIKNAFNKVRRNQGKAKDGASAFKDITHIDLGFDDIEALFESDVRQIVAELKNKYPKFRTYPGLVQLGMLDLAYNMGTRHFASEFTDFKDGLDDRNWAKVAAESRRTEVDDKGNLLKHVQIRNNIVQGWFYLAISEEPFYINPDCNPKQLPAPHVGY